jgi:esterase
MNSERLLFFRKTGNGKPVVILHGLFGMSDNWQGFSKQLALTPAAVYAIDLRNHGHSFHDAAFSLEKMSDDLEKLFLHENLNDVVLIGHSLGGKVAMKFALTFSSYLRGLMIIDIAPRYYPVHHQGVIEALKRIDLSEIKSRKEAETILVDSGVDVATRQFLLKSLYWISDKQLAWRFNLKAIEKNIQEVGKEISASKPFIKPVLFVRGENSDYISADDMHDVKKLFPQAELKTAPEAGHWVHADNPEWLLKETVRFINS